MKKYIKRLYIWGVIVFLVVAASMYTQHLNNHNLIEKNVKEMTSLSVNLLNEKINSWLSIRAQVIDDLGDNFSYGNYNDKKKLKLMENMMEENEEFFSIYYGTPNNKMINASGWKSPANFDLRKRPWYKKAVKKESLVFTEAFVNASSDHIIVTIAKPVYDKEDNSLKGVIAGDLSINTIIDFVKEEKQTEKGFFVLIDSENNILAHPDHEYSLIEGPPALGEKYENSLHFNSTYKNSVKKINLKNEEGFLTYSQVRNTEWYLGSFIPLDNYTDTYSSLFRSFMRAFLVSAIVFLIFFYLHTKYVFSPLKQFDKDIRKIDLENNLDYRIDVTGDSDLKFLKSSINDVLDKTQNYFEELKEKRNYINFLANHDPLTELPNRRKFMDKLKEELKNGNKGAVLLLDLDNFKDINDTLGHVYGDKVLKRISKKLLELESDNIFVSRFGGDEFLILIKGETDTQIIDECIVEITKHLEKPLIVYDNELHIEFSLGVTLFPDDSKNMNQLITNADTAMYKVKRKGKGHYMYFNESMTKKLNEKKRIKSIMRDALKNDEFRLEFQPQVNLKTGKADKFEALIRLEKYKISPGKFIPIAEETGLIIDIGRWVTKKSIEQIREWKEAGLKEKKIAINFSGEQLNDSNYVKFLQRTLKENEVKSELIEIEITENILIEYKKESLDFLDKLKELGVKIALDDFGTGYSSFSQLTFLPADSIKLDKILIERFVSGEKLNSIKSLINLIHSLDLKVVAEGIEEYDLFKYLKNNNCDYIQGYLFSRPLEEKDLRKNYNKNYLS